MVEHRRQFQLGGQVPHHRCPAGRGGLNRGGYENYHHHSSPHPQNAGEYVQYLQQDPSSHFRSLSQKSGAIGPVGARPRPTAVLPLESGGRTNAYPALRKLRENDKVHAAERPAIPVIATTPLLPMPRVGGPRPGGDSGVPTGAGRDQEGIPPMTPSGWPAPGLPAGELPTGSGAKGFCRRPVSRMLPGTGAEKPRDEVDSSANFVVSGHQRWFEVVLPAPVGNCR